LRQSGTWLVLAIDDQQQQQRMGRVNVTYDKFNNRLYVLKISLPACRFPV